MFRSRWAHDESVADVLSDITSAHLVFDIDHAWFVVGPSGLFVICEDDGDLVAATQRAGDRARSLRDRLANELSWVPFVDALVVTRQHDVDDDTPTPELECPVIRLDLLRNTLTEGPRSVDDDTLGRLALLGFRRSS